MKNDLFNKIPELEELLLNKKFNELNQEQKLLILGYITEIEYSRLQKDILLSGNILRNELETTALNPEVKSNLKSVFHPQRISIKEKFLSLFYYRIPAYQFIILLAAGLVIISGLTKSVKQIQVVKIQKDTVYVQKTSYIADKTEKPKEVQKDILKNKTDIKAKKELNLEDKINSLIYLTANQKSGTNLMSDFFVGNYITVSQ